MMPHHPLDTWLVEAEQSLRAAGMTGRRAYAAVCRCLSRQLDLPKDLWLDGPDLPAGLDLAPPPLDGTVDLFGLAYERFFPEVFKAEHGQFFTPAPLARLVVALTGVHPGDTVLDPTCGAGTFLVLAAELGASVHGIEVDPELAALCRLNLALHEVPADRVRVDNLFAAEPRRPFDVILANPPFSVPITDPTVLARYTLAHDRARQQSDVLFLEAAHARLRPGGRLGVVLPWSVVSNPRFASLRAWLAERFVRKAIVGLPEGVFRPFGGAAGRAALVVLEKRPASAAPWIAAMVDHLGYDPRRNRVVPTLPDGLADLATAARAGTAPLAPADSPHWSPVAITHRSSIAPGRTIASLGSLATLDRRALKVGPHERLTEIDLADVDKNTGEVTAAREKSGQDIRGSKAELFPGDLVVARMRPSLNNVALVRPPDPTLPERIFGSSEWVRLVPRSHPHFVLTAARSEFVREALADTGGQTRPRASVQAIENAEVPVPSPAAVALLDRIIGDAHRVRARARLRMDHATEAYAAWGRGDIEDADLQAILTELLPGEDVL
jgi:SAM-dependent methyltransferase